MHPYHLPNETEFTTTQDEIVSYHKKVAEIDRNIDLERQCMDDALTAVQERHRPSMDAISASIKAFLEEKESQLALIRADKEAQEAEIRDASRKKVAEWELQRATLDKEVESNKGFIAPIRRLPSELLSEIFMWAELDTSSWVLTRVCKSWRSVALRTPRLWRHISIHREKWTPLSYSSNPCLLFPRSLEEDPESSYSSKITGRFSRGDGFNQSCHSVEGLQKALKLTGTTTLSFTIDLPHDGEVSHDRDWFLEIFRLIASNLSRCQSLAIHKLPHDDKLADEVAKILTGSDWSQLRGFEIYLDFDNPFIKVFLPMVRKISPQLSRLMILAWENVYNYLMPKLKLSRLPRLAQLSISGPGLPPIEGQPSAWSDLRSLTHLQFNQQDLTQWSASLLPALESLSIDRGSATDLGGALPTVKVLLLEDIVFHRPILPISAPSLETLILKSQDIEVLKAINAPKLDRLLLIQTDSTKSRGNEAVSNIWNSNQHQNQLNPSTLYIDVEANDVVLVKALRNMDKIVNLGVGIRDKQNTRHKLFKEISTASSASSKTQLCPNLKNLQVFIKMPDLKYVRKCLTDRARFYVQVQELTSARPDLIFGVNDVAKGDSSGQVSIGVNDYFLRNFM